MPLSELQSVSDDLRFHRSLTVVDGHSDLVVDILRRHARGERAVFRERYAQELREAGVTVIMLSTGGDAPVQNLGSDDPLWCTLKRILAIHREHEESQEVVSLCTSMDQVDAALRADKLALLMMIEGGRPLRTDLATLDLYYRLGIRSVQLTWNERNPIGDGCAEQVTGGGLTRFGRAVVQEMNRRGMLIDLSHASEATYYSVAETSTAPFIVSHANAQAVCNHVRNLTDDQIRLLAARGGVIGVCFFPKFVDADRPSIDRLLDHVDHIARLVGTSHISLGPDFISYALDLFQAELTAGNRSDIYGTGFSIPEELKDVRALPLVTRGLLRRGYSREDIEGILGTNLLRVYRQVIG